ncbi:mechanosensitive ion channel family protein [Robertkochia solimangrovi]|uniref:mechanosensitive ion channel family protein n=1 Tax=Robertkochia solimangrovi TaxID=2213046 RepID=UPI001F5510AB|nr:mechanosensitive ion channel family protein [Robertkochia solimangrovi]
MIDQIGSWLEKIVVNLPNFVIACIVFGISFLLSRYVNNFMLRILKRTSMQDTVKHVTARLTSISIIMVGIFLALGIMNLNKMLTSLLAGAGVAGLAVGLALQGTLANTFSGIVLSFVKHVKMGDWIESNSYQGEVVDIDLRTTTLKQVDNNLVSIPNRMVIENPVKNYSVTAQSRVILTCGVTYDADLDLVREVVVNTIIDNFEDVGNKQGVMFFYTEFGDSSINFEVRFWIHSTSGIEILKARGEAIVAIKKAFDKNGISIPFPIRTIDFSNKLQIAKNPEKLADSDNASEEN